MPFDIQEAINDYLYYFKTIGRKDNTIKSEKMKLNVLAQKYEETKDLNEAVIQCLKSQNRKSSFDVALCIYRKFLDFNHINFDFKNIEFDCNYLLSFSDLKKHIQLAQDNIKNFKNRRGRNLFFMSRLCAYLLWIGVESKNIPKLKKQNYDSKHRILYTDNGTFDLNQYIYNDCCEIIHNELLLNISAKEAIYNSESGVQDYVECAFENNITNWEEYSLSGDYLMRGRTTNESTYKWIRVTTSNYIYNAKDIYISGLFNKLYKYELINNIKIQKDNFMSICKQFNYPLGNCTTSLSEYNDYKKMR